MKTYKALLIATLSASLHQFADAQNYVYYTGPGGRGMSVDLSSIRPAFAGSNAAYVEVKWTNERPDGTGADYILRKFIVDCQAGVAKAIDWVGYTSDGIKLYSKVYREEEQAVAEYREGLSRSDMTNLDTLDQSHNSACISILRWMKANPDLSPKYQINATSSKTYIPLNFSSGVYHVSVELNGLVDAEFIVDTGAADVSISNEVFQKLLSLGAIRKSDLLGYANYRIADGSVVRSMQVNIQQIKVGSIILKNLKASVSSGAGSPLLLGQTMLRRLGQWRINSETKTLEVSGR